ncbi:MAG: hypothetical protein JJU45_04425 [Acidimicrobiia bacterium]|nr:hypothetical protein [Acidimicrobiia bacterium]
MSDGAPTTGGFLQPSAIGRGTLVGVALVVPLGLLQGLAPAGSGVVWLLLGLILVAMGVAGRTAALAAAANPLSNGALAAAGTFAVVQSANIVLRIARGDDIAWVGIPLILGVCTSCGAIGAWLTMWRQAARGDSIGDAP